MFGIWVVICVEMFYLGSNMCSNVDLDARLLDARDQDELVGGRGAREHAELRPDLVKLLLVDALLRVLRVLLGLQDSGFLVLIQI